MKRLAFIALAVGAGLMLARPRMAAAQSSAPPGGAYKMVSSLVALPDFVPGLGTLSVDPSTLPAGPFLAYDQKGKLVSSIYIDPAQGHEQPKGISCCLTGASFVERC
jgi:hypothetical protein